MGEDVGCEIIIGSELPNFGKNISEACKLSQKYENTLHYNNITAECNKNDRNEEDNKEGDDENEEEKDYIKDMINEWLNKNHPKFHIIGVKEFYYINNIKYYLSYKVENGISLKKLKILTDNISEDEFNNIYNIIAETNDKIKPRLYGLPYIW